MSNPLPRHQPAPRKRHPVREWRPWRVARLAYLSFGFGGSYVLAAAIAFYSLVCLGPLGLLLAAALQPLLGPGHTAYGWLQVAARELAGPAAEAVLLQVRGLLTHPETHLVSIVSVVLLIWAGLRLFETVERSLTGLWPGKVLRGYFGRKLAALAMMLVAGVLLGSFVLLQVAGAAAAAWLREVPQVDPTALRALRQPLLQGAQLVLAILAYTLVYKFAPVQRVPRRAALVGALVAAPLWQIGSRVFGAVLVGGASPTTVYGGLAGVVVFALWALMGAWILLLGAHVSVAYEHIYLRARPPEEDDALIGWPGRPGATPTAPGE